MAKSKTKKQTKKNLDKPTKRSKRRTDLKAKAPERKKYRSFRLEKRIKADASDLPSVGQLTVQTWQLLMRNKLLIGGVTLIYGVIYFLLLRAVPAIPVPETQSFLESVYEPNPLLTNLTVSALVLSTSFGVEVGFAGAMGLVSTIIASLAMIYVYRLRLADKKVALREAYYFGPEQLVPFVLILVLIVAQLVPFAGGAVLFNAVLQSGALSGFDEHLLFGVIWFLLSLMSAYWLANSLMSLYAVTLPKMHPFKALQATAELVGHRRYIVFRKILFIIVVLLIMNVTIILGSVWVYTDAAFVARDVAGILTVPILHAYLFTLYRSLI